MKIENSLISQRDFWEDVSSWIRHFITLSSGAIPIIFGFLVSGIENIEIEYLLSISLCLFVLCIYLSLALLRDIISIKTKLFGLLKMKRPDIESLKKSPKDLALTMKLSEEESNVKKFGEALESYEKISKRAFFLQNAVVICFGSAITVFSIAAIRYAT